MSSKTPAIALRDIVEAIGWIETFTAGMDLDGFREDHRTIAAVERKLLVISEAAIRLGDEADILCPDQPWPSIRGTGNWLRHAYDRIDIETVWRTVTNDLPPLKAATLAALESLTPEMS